MTNEEHTEKDFQVATQKMLQEQGAVLRTILQNQMFIMCVLSKTNQSYFEEVNIALKENRKFMNDYVKNNLPSHSDMIVPLK